MHLIVILPIGQTQKLTFIEYTQKLFDGFKVYNYYMNFNIIKSFYYLICLGLNYLKKSKMIFFCLFAVCYNFILVFKKRVYF